MSNEIVSQVHYPVSQSEPILVEPHPERLLVTVAAILKGEREQKSFEDFLETTPNRNDEYADVLSVIDKKIEEDGLGAGHTIILEDTDYVRAISNLDDVDNTPSNGRYTGGYSLIREDKESIERYGRNFLIHIGLHERAHASMGKNMHTVTTRPIGGVVMTNMITAGGFHKWTYPKGEDVPMILGDFWEEGFADSYRVRAMDELGIGWDLPGRTISGMVGEDSEPFRYVGSESSQPILDEHGVIAQPAKYASASVYEMDEYGKAIPDPTVTQLMPSTAGIAACAVDLLDARVPGLFEDMKNSRTDSKAYARFVQKVESVEPGLYRKLSELTQTNANFHQGLKLVIHALGIEGSTVTG